MEKRAQRYPVIVEQALALYMIENYDGMSRLKEIVSNTKKFVTDTLALDPQVATIRVVIANQTSPDGTPESYDYAYLGVFFSNVTRTELDGYASKLNAAFESNRKALFTHPDGVDLPAPEAYVPSAEWIRSQQEELGALASKTKGWFNGDGSLNTEATKDETQRVLKDVAGKEGGASLSSGGSYSSEGAVGGSDDFDMDDFI